MREIWLVDSTRLMHFRCFVSPSARYGKVLFCNSVCKCRIHFQRLNAAFAATQALSSKLKLRGWNCLLACLAAWNGFHVVSTTAWVKEAVDMRKACLDALIWIWRDRKNTQRKCWCVRCSSLVIAGNYDTRWEVLQFCCRFRFAIDKSLVAQIMGGLVAWMNLWCHKKILLYLPRSVEKLQ